MSKREQAIGKAGEDASVYALRLLGVRQIESIGTPVKVVPHPTLKGYYRVGWGETVIGDRRGVLPGGRSVLCETKTILSHNLRWSDFRDHQPAALTEHAELGGLSLVCWVSEVGPIIMEWPIDGFGPGRSISIAEAREVELCGGDWNTRR